MSDVSKYTGQQWRALGAAIKRRRVQLGLSQQELADAAGVGVNTVGNIESEAKQRRELTLADICTALGWTRDSYLRILEGEAPAVVDAEPAKIDGVIYERPPGLSDALWDELKGRFDQDYELYKRLGGGN